jgi:ABC-2 type transport system ATP-binding protein
MMRHRFQAGGTRDSWFVVDGFQLALTQDKKPSPGIFERNHLVSCLFNAGTAEVFVRRNRVFPATLAADFSRFTQAMIEVSNLTKRYAGRTAVDDISFTVARGEIVGLLGPNGAGKSTTMRVLSGFMPATSGTVRVAGFDVFHDADEARQRIGYMPENNPLYPDMRVREYLKFRARLKGLGWRKSRERVTTVMEQCGLTDVSKRIIGQLSKGYKQRVGLADALVHDPDLIILDEPTIGLDPQQIRSVRALIKSLAGKHTVLISTHILPEVEMMCGRVLIMFGGRVLASDTPDNLQRRMAGGSQVIAEISAPIETLHTVWESLPEVEAFDIAPGEGDFFRCALTPRDGQDLRAIVYALARQNGWALRELTRSRHSLEDIYIQVTKPTTEEIE